MYCLVTLVATLRAGRGEAGGKGWISCYHADRLFHQALFLRLKEAGMMQRLPCQAEERA